MPLVQDKEARNSHIEIAIVGDYMEIENIELTLKKIKKYSHLCKIIVCHVHTRPDQKLINLYSRYNIIPYLFQEFKLKESKVLINCKYIITTNEYAMQGNQFINGINEIEKTLRKDDPFIRINPKDLDRIFQSRYLVQSTIKTSEEINILPENIPGPNKPKCLKESKLDLMFVTNILTKNWILDGIAKEIGSRGQLSWGTYYTRKGIVEKPLADRIFFMHVDILLSYNRKDMIDYKRSKIYCWYTHPKEEDESKLGELLGIFERITKIFFTCTSNMNLWISRGVDAEKCECIIGGYEEQLFKPHDRLSSSLVGICSSFYERKDPMLLTKIITNKSDKQFLLLGKDWENFSYFDYLMSSGNIKYKRAKYSEYPYYYSQMSVFLSTSKLEGGPIPLLEAMASNCIPVTTDTGFAQDVIKHGSNGYIYKSTENCPV